MTGHPNTQTAELITPERAKEIKRAAFRHAAGMLTVSLNEWAPQEYAAHDARNDAEEELLREEVERLAEELQRRSLAGTDQPVRRCEQCGRTGTRLFQTLTAPGIPPITVCSAKAACRKRRLKPAHDDA